jgi:YidC/Oxa1 family membrane protein insertase
MDRNTLIGFLLIGLIFIVWFQLLTPTPPPKSPKPKALDSAALAYADSVEKALSQKNLAMQKVGEFARVMEGTADTLTVETDLFTAKLSSKGATLISFVQKKYLDWERKPFDLITAKDGALSLLFETTDARQSVVNTNDLYFTPKVQERTFKLSSSQSATIPFEVELENGKRIKITYTFTGNKYQIRYQTELVGVSQLVRGANYQISWNGGLAHSEKDELEEANSSYAHAYFNGSLEKLDADSKDKEFKLQPDGSTKWVSVQSKYFLAAILADEAAEGAYLQGRRIVKDDKHVFEDYTVALKQRLPLNQDVVQNGFTLYIGPLDYVLVREAGSDLEKTMDFGWEWITRPFAEWIILPVFNLLERFIPNYGLIIIIFALLIKLVTYPLTVASTNSMKKMAQLQPQIQEVQKKYADDPVKLQNELGKIYKEAGVNPLSGCLPVLLQMPLLFAMFYVIRSSIQLRQESFLWATDLSTVDAIIPLPFSIPLYGSHIAIFPILMAITTYFQQKLTPTTAPPEQTKIFNIMLPLMLLLFFNNMPSGLGLYYLMFNVFSIVQQLYVSWQAKRNPAPVGSKLAPAPKVAQDATKKNPKKKAKVS